MNNFFTEDERLISKEFPQKVQDEGKKKSTSNYFYFNSPGDLLTSVEKAIRQTEVVLDIGCGIVPMNYFRPKLHLMIEPWKEYSDILTYRYSGDKSIIVIRTGALDALSKLANNSVDSIFFLDVIEHLEKSEGMQVIKESERVAREQIVIFTPLGFMPQHMDSTEPDGWGLSGSTVQEHLSGWTPEDFTTDWSFYICKDFHRVDFKGDRLEKSHGAFYAIRNFEEKVKAIPEKLSDIRRPLPSEIEVQRLLSELQQKTGELQQKTGELQQKTGELQQKTGELQQLNLEFYALYNSNGMQMIRLLKKILRTIGIKRFK